MIRRILRFLRPGSPVEDALREHHEWRLMQDRHRKERWGFYRDTNLCGHTLHALKSGDEANMLAVLRGHHAWRLKLAEDPGQDYGGTELGLLTERALREAGE